MKILFLCHRFPYPADGGGKIRALEMIRHLSARHEVHLISMLRSDDEAREAGGIARWCAYWVAPRVGIVSSAIGALFSVLRGRSISEGYFGAAGVRRAVERALAGNRYDRIVVHCSSMAPHVADQHGTPKLLDLCDLDSEKWRQYALSSKGWRRWLYGYEQAAVARLERRMACAFDLNTLATPNERDALIALAPDAPVDWFPNGVDLAYFSPLPEGPQGDTLVFVGRMDYLPNARSVTKFCEQTLPLIRQQRAQVKFIVIGAEPPPEVRRLAEIEGVTVTGSVPDVRPYLARGRAMVAPLEIARGVQNKILESMAIGVPVVTSALAARGVDARPGQHLVCADTPREVADACVRLLADDVHWREIRDAALVRVRERYGWGEALSGLDRMLEGLGAGAQ